MECIDVEIRGTRPLLMNNPAKMVREREIDKVKGRSGIQPSLQEEAETALYKDKDGRIIVPSLCVLSSLREAGKNRVVPGLGKKTYKTFVFSGVQIEPAEIPLKTANGWTIDVKRMKRGSGYIAGARPRFDEWSLTFQLKIVDVVMRPQVLKELLIDAGTYKGLCDFRPLYGLFEVTKWQEQAT